MVVDHESGLEASSGHSVMMWPDQNWINWNSLYTTASLVLCQRGCDTLISSLADTTIIIIDGRSS